MKRSIVLAFALLLVAACTDSPSPTSPLGLPRQSLVGSPFANSEWSEPVNLGPTINTAANELNATLSPDELSLYFTSNRAGGFGGTDMWVSHRACADCPWEAPVNLGSPINSADADAGPAISIDGHLLFFHSARVVEGGQGDIYLSRRVDPKDDFGWGEPLRLGPELNTPAFEAGAEYLQSAEDGATNLYFNRAPVGGLFHIYMIAVTRDGQIRGPVVPVSELNSAFAENSATLRADGREVVFSSSRPGTLGADDFWMSTRRSVHDSWSVPEHLGAPLSSSASDRQPNLSRDARTLIFASMRTGGFGGYDLWMSTRSPSGQ